MQVHYSLITNSQKSNQSINQFTLTNSLVNYTFHVNKQSNFSKSLSILPYSLPSSLKKFTFSENTTKFSIFREFKKWGWDFIRDSLKTPNFLKLLIIKYINRLRSACFLNCLLLRRTICGHNQRSKLCLEKISELFFHKDGTNKTCLM